MKTRIELLKLVELLPYGSFPVLGANEATEVEQLLNDVDLQSRFTGVVSRYGSLSH